MIETRGTFWLAGTPDRVSVGTLTHGRGEQPAAVLANSLVDDVHFHEVEDDNPGHTKLTFAPPADRVAAFQPATLHAHLVDGTWATGLFAQNHGGDAVMTGDPIYRIRYLLIGDTLHDEDDYYEAVRFQLDAPGWMPRVWAEQKKAPVGETGALDTDSDEDGSWLRYVAHKNVPLNGMVDDIVYACLTFMKIALRKPLTIFRVQVRREGANTWTEVLSRRAHDTPHGLRPEPLLAPECLTIERFARFLTLHHRLDGLTDPVAHPPGGPIQVQLLAQAAVVEGIHRRLWKDRKRFQPPEGKSLKAARKAAKKAGVTQLVEDGIADEATATKCFDDALAHIDEISFVERVVEVVAEVNNVLPEVFESVPGFALRLVAARDELAHQLKSNDPDPEPLHRKLDRWTVLNWVTPWMLQVLILLRAGVTPQEVATCIQISRDFAFHRANTATVATELGWIDADANPNSVSTGITR
ncbi:HEPN domain-containing protein [Antrihabitans sp. YC2-6]|uniref:HEPN domain-containing protein n=1 Tax=Antrihabitans sp. YC2-6 TaxID=2799498 RepID=UPI0018F27D1C|nr:HEPN domain-containing protein [Antrihabitans sp. YC2-6]MBJ8348272.1 hypothetical protein [Antrihabitans sp. YC2-6]